MHSGLRFDSVIERHFHTETCVGDVGDDLTSSVASAIRGVLKKGKRDNLNNCNDKM